MADGKKRNLVLVHGSPFLWTISPGAKSQKVDAWRQIFRNLKGR